MSSYILKILKFIFLIILFVECTQHDKKLDSNSKLKIVEARGYIVPKDSISEPKVIPLDESKLKKIPVGTPKITPANTNVRIVSNPKIIIAGIPKVYTLGKDSISIPKVISIVDSPFIAGIAEVVLAKDAYIKEQNPQNFSSLGKLQGLNHDYVRCIIQDKIGNLWFGTYGGGVSKYDGKYFTHYTEKEGLSSNYVNCIIQDNEDNIWIGTNNGITKYDGKYFTHYTEKEGLSNNYITCMFQDNDNNIWIGTLGYGVIKHSSKDNSFISFHIKGELKLLHISCIMQDNDENLWFGVYKGGAIKFDGKSFFKYSEKEGLSNEKITSIIQDKDNNIWFGILGEGVCKYDGKTFTHYTEKEGLCSNIVTSITQDKKGNLWFGTRGRGVSLLNKEGNLLTNFTKQDGLIDDYINTIYQDKSGNIWLGTYNGGVIEYNGKLFTSLTTKEGLSSNFVTSIIQDKKGNLWFGAIKGGGVLKYDGICYTHYTVKEGLSSNDIFKVIQDNNENIWFGTYEGGVSRLNSDGKFIVNYKLGETMYDNNIFSVFQDKEGNIWFGSGNGVYRLNSDNKSITHYTVKEGLCDNMIFSIIQDKYGDLWFGTKVGVCKYDGKTFTHYTEKEGFINNTVFSIIQDKNGNLWFGTKGGTCMYNGKTFTNFTEKEGLSSNIVFSILQDKNKNIWFNTSYGISKLNKKSLYKIVELSEKNSYSTESKENVFFKSYTYENGFIGKSYEKCSIYEDNKGVIWIGSNDMLFAYHPEGDEPDTIPPNIQLTGVSLYNDNIAWINLENNDSIITLNNGVNVADYKFEGISKWYNLPKNLSLAYNNNYLSFNFIGITQNQSKIVKYKYKLEGIDNSWNAITNRTEATYGNLPHGNYTFKVKAVNSDGYWSNEYNYNFTIRPPWWETWWFRVIVVLFIVLIIVVYIKFRERKLIREKNLLEKTVKLRTAEVISQKEEIEHIHKEISQSIDYAKRIQTAILHEPDLLNSNTSEHFVLFKPKDKVSGDFYWWSMVENYLIITVADCTGHGVPGAFMSMLGTSFLREIIVKQLITNPSDILKQLRLEIIHALKQKGVAGEQKDGMDMALISINIDTLELQYAGANNPLYIISSLNNELIEIKPNKMPIAIHENMGLFTNHEYKLQKGDSIYLLSDGYQDQFGGPNNKKYMSKQLKKLLVDNNNISMKEQRQLLETILTEWIKDGEQIDDITIVGIRI